MRELAVADSMLMHKTNGRKLIEADGGHNFLFSKPLRIPSVSTDRIVAVQLKWSRSWSGQRRRVHP